MQVAPPPPRSYGLEVSCNYGMLPFYMLVVPRAVLLAELTIGMLIGVLEHRIARLVAVDASASVIVPCYALQFPVDAVDRLVNLVLSMRYL